ncbi:hypothetical protein EV144_103300 [Flavobacterium sp. 270]|uniref:hypothetical protein n=1 Tax=Flavobacterium sp. 270 TaxID=2512114 RepID=UPI00106673CE|nr:hypothetical protein [Flavobacterium sp. 270]TDW48783.1 hypothetical protein EV144_103300 [Flavobacterium sp. 270]
MNKRILVVILISIVVFFIVKQLVYKPYMWKKAINSKEHKLQLGSFIFSKQRGSNGSQSYTTYYFVFKVIEINGDFVRLSVIRKLSDEGVISQDDFSTTSEHYKALKENVNQLLITPILSEDLHKGKGSPYELNDYLLEKYPDLKKSRYYFEDIPAANKNKPVPKDPNLLITHFDMVYSKKAIIEEGKLTQWVYDDFKKVPEIAERLSNNIDLILN